MNLKLTAIALIAIVALVAFSGCAKQACQADAKICPDGTTVARNPNNNCEFDPCPDEVNSSDIPMPNLNEIEGTEEEPPELPL